MEGVLEVRLSSALVVCLLFLASFRDVARRIFANCSLHPCLSLFAVQLVNSRKRLLGWGVDNIFPERSEEEEGREIEPAAAEREEHGQNDDDDDIILLSQLPRSAISLEKDKPEEEEKEKEEVWVEEDWSMHMPSVCQQLNARFLPSPPLFAYSDFYYSPTPFQACILSHMQFQREQLGHRRGIVHMATGLGKTVVCFVFMFHERPLSSLHLLLFTCTLPCLFVRSFVDALARLFGLLARSSWLF